MSEPNIEIEVLSKHNTGGPKAEEIIMMLLAGKTITEVSLSREATYSLVQKLSKALRETA